MTWVTTLGSVVVVTAVLVALLLVQGPPVVGMPQSLQIGVGTGIAVTAPGSSPIRPPVVLSTKLSRVVIVTPQQPVTDRDDQHSVDSDDGTSSVSSPSGSIGQ
ncbi:MAG: hypothetical protein HKL85_07685 [Acidimicrobiaceae bacterium]|nr:hypothetical protein [Acidimicrobiaceae bacterium]